MKLTQEQCSCGLTQYQLDIHKLVGTGGVCQALDKYKQPCGRLLGEHPDTHFNLRTDSIVIPKAEEFASCVYILCSQLVVEEIGGNQVCSLPLATCFSFSNTLCVGRRHCLYQDAEKCEGRYESFSLARTVKGGLCEVVSLLTIVAEDRDEDWVIFSRVSSTFKKHLHIAHIDEQPPKDDYVVLVSAPVGIFTSGNKSHLRVEVSPPVMVYHYTFDPDRAGATVVATKPLPKGYAKSIFIDEDDEDEETAARGSSLDPERSVLVVQGGQVSSGSCGGPYIALNTGVVAAMQLWSFNEATPRSSDVSDVSSDLSSASYQDLEVLSQSLDAVAAGEAESKKRKERTSADDSVWRRKMLDLMKETMKEHGKVVDDLGATVDLTQSTYLPFNAGTVLAKLTNFCAKYKELTDDDLSKPRK